MKKSVLIKTEIDNLLAKYYDDYGKLLIAELEDDVQAFVESNASHLNEDLREEILTEILWKCKALATRQLDTASVNQ